MPRGQVRDEPHTKQSLYFPNGMLAELAAEARRLDRSLSWVIQRCVKSSLPSVRALPRQDANIHEAPNEAVNEMTHNEVIVSLRELRDMSCDDDDPDSPAQQTIDHAIRAIEALVSVRGWLDAAEGLCSIDVMDLESLADILNQAEAAE